MMMLRSLSMLALLAAVSADAEALKGHNVDAPVDVHAQRIEVQDRADRVVFSGDVRVVQGNLSLDAGRLTVIYAGKPGASISIKRLDAIGGVTVRSTDQVARGAMAIYDLDARVITMMGGVQLQQGSNNVSGGRLVIDLNSGRSVIDGAAAGAPAGVSGNGGRVSGHFTVQRKN